MKKSILSIAANAAAAGLAIAAAAGITGCGADDGLHPQDPETEEVGTITLSGEIAQIYQTRANDSGFADKDRIGVYIVDYAGASAGALKSDGNRADNVRFTFDEGAYKWTPDHDIYWKDKETHIDVYGYYPYSSTVENVNEYAFEVRKDQNSETLNGSMGGYEASDFLWGKAEDAAPTDKVVRISFTHRMAGIRVSLMKGIGFSDEEWAAADKEVLILNTKCGASVDLATGTVTATGKSGGAGIVPYRKGEDFRAVVAPQEVAAGIPLISVTVAGSSYSFSRGEATVFNPSKQHNFTITVNKKGTGDFEFSPSGESITAWENDPVSHQATIKEYVVVNVEEPGTLDECVKAAGKDLEKIKNLKLTGRITSRDFAVMKFLMPNLNAINLKEVTIVKGKHGNLGSEYYYENRDNEIPSYALKGTLISSLVLPDNITTIAYSSFCSCKNLTGSLIIPEGVTLICDGAFSGCASFSGQLSLPESLKHIGSSAFDKSGFCSELILPASLEYIGSVAFADCKGFYGELHLPETLTYIGAGAFSETNFTGGLRIPDGIHEIQSTTFYGCEKLNGALILHDNITKILESAFFGCGFKGELRLPENLIYLGEDAFRCCDFMGELKIPQGLSTIPAHAFAENSRLSGVLEIPDNIHKIDIEAFVSCSGLEGVIFPENLENIRSGAFGYCHGINRIVCKGDIPPYIQEGAFDGVEKNNFTVEVPESAVAQYRIANGWRDFKRISSYRNFIVRPYEVFALNTKVTRDIVLDADDEWTVESMPDWVKLSQTEGKGKTALKLDFLQMPHGDNRHGEIVFKLKDKNYRTTCAVHQFDFQYPEDEVITLQKATKGNGVNLVFLGDGYSAWDIYIGTLLTDISEAVGHFFDIEPYKTYREYFNIYTAIALSPESGIGGVNTVVHNRFNTYDKGNGVIGALDNDSDYKMIFEYACKAPTVTKENLNQTLIVIVPNTIDYGGMTYMYNGGEAISYCPKGDYGYPLDFRGTIQHEAGGHGFGKLADECVYFSAFAGAETSTAIKDAQKRGWYENVSVTGKMNEVPWSHLIFDERYSNVVDIYEGACMFSRGVYRSEANSCMSNNVPYYNTISREAIVKRIMEYAGLEYSFEDFVANDKTNGSDESGATSTRSPMPGFSVRTGMRQNTPVFLGARDSER